MEGTVQEATAPLALAEPPRIQKISPLGAQDTHGVKPGNILFKRLYIFMRLLYQLLIVTLVATA